MGDTPNGVKKERKRGEGGMNEGTYACTWGMEATKLPMEIYIKKEERMCTAVRPHIKEARWQRQCRGGSSLHFLLALLQCIYFSYVCSLVFLSVHNLMK